MVLLAVLLMTMVLKFLGEQILLPVTPSSGCNFTNVVLSSREIDNKFQSYEKYPFYREEIKVLYMVQKVLQGY